MGELGILVYGYKEEDASKIKEVLEGVLGDDMDLISGSRREDETLKDILMGYHSGNYEEKEQKILVFLGFEDEHVQNTLKGFPTDVDRPIFCGLTGQNIDWKLGYLVDHLIEEDGHWKQQRKKNEC